MPALYAHNKFGKLVIPKLPSTIKETVRKYPNEFRMGLQGPDFLFFYLTRKDITKMALQCTTAMCILLWSMPQKLYRNWELTVLSIVTFWDLYVILLWTTLVIRM